MDRRRLRAWLAAKDNKPSLCVITMPQPWEILLGEARTTQNMRDLDIRILTPLSYIDGLLDGHRSLLESLTLPTECFLLDAGFIRAIEPFAHRLTTSNVVKTALDDARGNLSVLRHWPGMKSAKRNKSMAETARLLNGVRHIQSGTEAWPCLLDADEITLLRRIRLHGMNLADLERDYGLLQIPANAPSPSVGALCPQTGRRRGSRIESSNRQPRGGIIFRQESDTCPAWFRRRDCG